MCSKTPPHLPLLYSTPLLYLDKSRQLHVQPKKKGRYPEPWGKRDPTAPQKKISSKYSKRNIVFKSAKWPSTSKSPDFLTYGPSVAERIKQTKPDTVDLFLMMYPPTLRDLTVETLNTYSLQTKGEILDLNKDGQVADCLWGSSHIWLQNCAVIIWPWYLQWNHFKCDENEKESLWWDNDLSPAGG